jgi:site-specific DNA-methyltransferase (adenine-specific)
MLLFVVPSRWFVGGKGLDKFRDFMIKRTDIVLIQHEDNSKKWFGNGVNIEGGVNYFLKDAGHNGLCLFNGESYALSKYDCIIKPTYHAIIDAVINMESVNQLYMGRFFGVETNDMRFKDSGKIKCFVSLQKSKDRYKYLENFEFNEKNTFWKVITARANGKSPNFGAKFIGNPNEVHTGSYISFRVANEEEAGSLLSYLETKFANHMLSIRKISQDISENTCKWIPLVPLDRIWTDDAVCEYLKIDQTMYI